MIEPTEHETPEADEAEDVELRAYLLSLHAQAERELDEELGDE